MEKILFQHHLAGFITKKLFTERRVLFFVLEKKETAGEVLTERDLFRRSFSMDLAILKEGKNEEKKLAVHHLESAEDFSFDFLTLAEAHEFRKQEEEKKETELPELQKMLAEKNLKDFSEKDWRFFTSFSLQFLLEKIEKNCILSFFSSCQQGSSVDLNNWVRSEFTPSEIHKIRIEDVILANILDDLLRIILEKEVMDPLEEAKTSSRNALQTGTEIFSAINTSAPEEDKNEEISDRHFRETDSMISAIQKLGDARLSAQAEELRNAEKSQIDDFNQENKESLRQKRTELFVQIQENIESRVQEAFVRGAQALRQEIPRLREQIAPFAEIVGNAFSDDYSAAYGKGGDPAKNAFLRNVEILFRRAEHYCQMTLSEKSSEEILEKLRPADFEAENSSDPDFVQGKIFLKLFLAHCAKVSAEAAKKSVLFREIRSDFFAQKNPREIAKKTGFSEEEVQNFFEKEKMPQSFEIPIFQKWGFDNGFSGEKIISLLSLIPAESVFSPEDDDFVATSLAQNPETAAWFSKSNKSFIRNFLDGGLLKIGTASLQSANDLVLGNYTRLENGEQIPEEARQQIFSEVQKKISPLQETDFPERARLLTEKLNKICDQNPENIEMRNTKNTLEKISNLGESPKYTEFSDFVASDFYAAAKRIRENEMPSLKNIESLFSDLEDQMAHWEKRAENQLNPEEENQKKILAEFSEWVQSGQEISPELLEKLRNAEILEILEDTQYRAKTGGNAFSNPAMIDFSGKFPRIFLAKSCLEKNPKMANSALRHEAAHLWDEMSGNIFSSEFWSLLHSKIPKEKWGNFEKFLKEHFSGEEISEETFAHAFASWDNSFLKKLHSLVSPYDFLEIQDFLKQDFFQKLKKEEIGKKETKRRFFSGEDFTPYAGRNEEYKRQFNAQLDRLSSNIDALIKTGDKDDQEKAEQGKEQAEQWIAKFSNPPEDPRKPIDKDSEEIIALVKKFNSDAENKMAINAEEEEPKSGYFEDLWANTTFLSLADLGAMWTTVTETLKRRHDRNSKLRTGKAGKSLFGESLLGNEFDNRKEAAENEEVGKYKEGLNNKDGWQIMERLEKTTNKDELKACLYLLSDNGRIDWYDRRIWRALERVGGGLTILDSDAGNLNALKTKLQKMCANLWDNDYFRGIDNTNGSAYESGKGKYKNELEANSNNMEGTMIAMLKQKRRGENVDPQRFEAYIDSCIRDGKSCPENIFWFILQGVNFGILNIDRVYYLDSAHLNNYPAIQWFNRQRPKINEIRQLAQKFPPDENMSIPANFNDWFLTVVMGNPGVLSRTIKVAPSVGEKLDHDWSTTLLAIGDAGLGRIVMGSDHGAPRMASTAYPNMTVGQLSYITALARNPQSYSEEDLEREIKRHASFAMTTHLLLSGSIKGEEFHSLSDYELDNPPRSSAGSSLYLGYKNAGKPNKRELKTKEIIESQYQILRKLDPEGFFFLDPSYIIDDDVEGTVKRINDHFGNLIPPKKDRVSLDILKYIEKMVEIAYERNPQQAREDMLSEAKKVYYEHHTGDPEGRAVPGARDWKEAATKVTGYDPNTSRGMYE